MHQKVVKLILFSRITALEFAASKHPEGTQRSRSQDFKSAVEQHWAALKFRPSADGRHTITSNELKTFSPLSPLVLMLFLHTLSSSVSVSIDQSLSLSLSISLSLSLSASPFSVVYSHLYPFFSYRAHPACTVYHVHFTGDPSIRNKLPCRAILQILTKKKSSERFNKAKRCGNEKSNQNLSASEVQLPAYLVCEMLRSVLGKTLD